MGGWGGCESIDAALEFKKPKCRMPCENGRKQNVLLSQMKFIENQAAKLPSCDPCIKWADLVITVCNAYLLLSSHRLHVACMIMCSLKLLR